MNKLINYLGIFLSILAIPLALYIWLKWGWYDGFVLAFNAVMNDPKSAGNFAWGVIKILIGGAFGAIIGLMAFFIGSLMAVKR